MKFKILLLALLSYLFICCSGNPEAEGDKLYRQGQYNQALTYYFKAKELQPSNPVIQEKIVLTYLNRGAALYRKTDNIETFIGNFDKAQNLFPDTTTSSSFDKAYSELLYEYALAFHRSEPTNEIQKRRYFNNSIDYLQEAIAYDPENQAADSLLSAIKKANFQRMFDKGMAYYDQARKDRHNRLYLDAEYYLSRAVSFDPASDEARKSLKRVREKTLSIADLTRSVAIAVTGKKYSGNHFLIEFALINNMHDPIDFNPENVILVDIEENTYQYDPEKTSQFKDGLSESSSLKYQEKIQGAMAFEISRAKLLKLIRYQREDGTTAEKYFP